MDFLFLAALVFAVLVGNNQIWPQSDSDAVLRKHNVLYFLFIYLFFLRKGVAAMLKTVCSNLPSIPPTAPRWWDVQMT